MWMARADRTILSLAVLPVDLITNQHKFFSQEFCYFDLKEQCPNNVDQCYNVILLFAISLLTLDLGIM